MEKNFLPPFNTIITSFKENKELGGFEAILRVNIETKNQAVIWLEEFCSNSFTTYKVDRTYPENTQKVVFKKEFNCERNTKPTSHLTMNPHPKHTGCNSKITITIKQRNMKRSKDVFLQLYPTEILLRFTHNHSVISLETLKQDLPTDEVKHIFANLFIKGHSPATALELYKMDLQDKHRMDYRKMLADNSICPQKKWCIDLYFKLFKKNYEKPLNSRIIMTLKRFITDYNKNVGQISATYTSEDDHLITALCTPFMKRVHQYIESSAGIVSVQSFNCMDQPTSRVYLLTCHSTIGELPLGVFVINSKSKVDISRGIKLLKKILPTESFYGRQKPNAFIIYNDADRIYFKREFPKSTLLRSEFHVLGEFAKYLWSNCIHSSDCSYIYKTFSKLLHIRETNNFQMEYDRIFHNETFKKYNQIINYLKILKTCSAEWATCERVHLQTDFNTNNYGKAGFRLIKNQILNRTKAFNIVQMFDYLVNNYEQHFIRRIINVLNANFEGYSIAEYSINKTKAKDVSCEHLFDNFFKVFCNNKEFIVNLDLEICTCSIAACKHQLAVIRKFDLDSTIVIPVLSSNDKENLKNLLKNEEEIFCENVTGVEFDEEPLILIVENDDEEIDHFNALSDNDTILTSSDFDYSEDVFAVDPEIDNSNFSNINCKTEHNIDWINLKIDNFCKIIKEKVSENSDMLLAVDAFLKNYKKIKTDHLSLANALLNFGKATMVTSENNFKVPIKKEPETLNGYTVRPTENFTNKYICKRAMSQQDRKTKKIKHATLGSD